MSNTTMNLDGLRELGLSDGQVRVYAAVLELGTGTLHSIQEKTGIERRNIYDILNKLIERGLVTYSIENGKRTYQPAHPNKIMNDLKQRRESLNKIESNLPDMVTLFERSKVPIRAEIFRGVGGVKAMLEEVLTYKESHWIGGNSTALPVLKKWWDKWMERRAEKKHIMYDLVDYGTWLPGLEPGKISVHKKHYYKYCTLPPKLASPMVIIIYGNNVAQVLWQKTFSFVIESEEIRNSFMKYFDYFWKD